MLNALTVYRENHGATPFIKVSELYLTGGCSLSFREVVSNSNWSVQLSKYIDMLFYELKYHDTLSVTTLHVPSLLPTNFPEVYSLFPNVNHIVMHSLYYESVNQILDSFPELKKITLYTSTHNSHPIDDKTRCYIILDNEMQRKITQRGILFVVNELYKKSNREIQFIDPVDAHLYYSDI